MGNTIDKEVEKISKQFEEDKYLIEEVKQTVAKIKEGRLDVEVKKSTTNKSLNDLKDILNDMITTINKNVNSNINPILSKLEDYSNLNFERKISQMQMVIIAKGLNKSL